MSAAGGGGLWVWFTGGLMGGGGNGGRGFWLHGKVKCVRRMIGQAKNRIKKTDRTNIITTNFV